MRRTAEFDAFGPWVYEVTTADEIPRLYRSHPVDLSAAHLVLKVPRPIWRRDANPDMDLYDHLIVVDAHAVTVLSRRGTGFSTTVIGYDRLSAVHSSVSLLDGRLQMRTVDAPAAGARAVDVRFNGVSRDLVETLVREVRALARTGGGGDGGGAPPGIELDLRDLGGDDVALVAAQRELARHDPSIVPVATHRRADVVRRGGGMQAVLNWLRPVTLHAVVVGRSPGQLHLVHRREWFSAGRHPVHSVAHTVVFAPRVTDVTDVEVTRYEDVRAVRVTSGASVIEMPHPTGADTGAAVPMVVEATSPT